LPDRIASRLSWKGWSLPARRDRFAILVLEQDSLLCRR
jgi:hypothetical protein